MESSELDYLLDTLLELDGFDYFDEEQWRVIFRVRRIAPDVGRPQGIDYSLVLLNSQGDRILAFDNAHPVREAGGSVRKMSTTFDHVHTKGKMEPYDFKDAGTLLEDFWNEYQKLKTESRKR